MFCATNLFAQKHIVSIDFQEYFKNDTISLLVNDTKIIENLNLTSNKIVGLSTSSRIIESKEKQLKFEYADFSKPESESIDLKELKIDQQLKISIKYNDHIFSKEFYIKDGKYIGVYKDKCNSIKFLQSEKGFEYQ
ncbi:hypothetical protein [Jejuia spongiicola]|uniref:Glycosyl-hydrolase 97 N-terminal domain-containing protein n=1 Tax=Jejuia spongiicola TaxID=2942207 RepID=A0ABT0QD42_9FLAO|nr:hypothetical protein [Jejuia spongiicola]MCL6294907.1 hypothetical protein [Jejuia spongiicola]